MLNFSTSTLSTAGVMNAGCLALAGKGFLQIAMVVLLFYGGLGAVDDWIKLRYAAQKGSRDGMKMWEKILFQIGFALLAAIFTYAHGRGYHVGDENPVHSFYFPFKSAPIYLP